MMRAKRRTSIVAAALVAVVSGCVASPRPPGVVVFASGTDLESGNPLVTVHPLSRQVQRFALFTTLARYDSALTPTPYAARRWSWSSDRRELTFSMVSSLVWSDGQPTTAADAAFTLLAARDPRVGYLRRSDLAAVDTVLAPNDSTVVVRFHSPQPAFPLVLCELPILPAHVLASIAPGDMRRAAFNYAPVSNGPFTFVERVAGQRWVFDRNPRFPAELGHTPHIDELVIAVVDEPTTKFAGLASGDLDFAGIAPTMAALGKRDPTMRVQDYPILFSTALVLNVHRPPFDDVRVRHAIDLSLNRDRIVSAALAGYARPASGPVVPESPLALERDIRHDPARADSLLDAAGWHRNGSSVRVKDGQSFVVTMLTVGSGDHALEQLVQADLAERGIRVEIRDMEMGAFLTQARATPKSFDLLVTGVTGDVSLAYLSSMYESAQRGGALDYSDYHTPRLDSLFARAHAATSTDASIAAWHDVQAELARGMPSVWIYHARGLQGISRRMQGVQLDLRGELASLTNWYVSGVSGGER